MPKAGRERGFEVVDHRGTTPQATDSMGLAGLQDGGIHCILVSSSAMEFETDLASHALTQGSHFLSGDGDFAEMHELDIQQLLTGYRLANSQRGGAGDLELESLLFLPNKVVAVFLGPKCRPECGPALA
ncbi:hypothetical protein FQZ97_962420 [compost metagenome]